jgi:hypothetical protein
MKSERPGILTFFCILGFIICFLGMILVISPEVQARGKLFAVYFSLNFAFLAVCLGGLWLMRQWAFWAYVGYFVVNQAVSFAFQVWSPQTLMPLILLAVAVVYYRRME